MYGMIQGVSVTERIQYCPICGEEITEGHADGTVTCNNCGTRFGVVEIDD